MLKELLLEMDTGVRLWHFELPLIKRVAATLNPATQVSCCSKTACR